MDQSIRVFDVNKSDNSSFEVSTTKNQFISQKSLISSISFNPLIIGMYAAGSYDKSIGLYDERTDKILNVLNGHKGGVTQIQFSISGWYLFSGGRKDDEIHCWDLRNQSILFSMKRNVPTNQKVQFDSNSKHLITGSSNGEVIAYELEQSGKEICRLNTNSSKFHH
jgi:telomerase Cajal body protein 1